MKDESPLVAMGVRGGSPLVAMGGRGRSPFVVEAGSGAGGAAGWGAAVHCREEVREGPPLVGMVHVGSLGVNGTGRWERGRIVRSRVGEWARSADGRVQRHVSGHNASSCMCNTWQQERMWKAGGHKVKRQGTAGA